MDFCLIFQKIPHTFTFMTFSPPGSKKTFAVNENGIHCFRSLHFTLLTPTQFRKQQQTETKKNVFDKRSWKVFSNKNQIGLENPWMCYKDYLEYLKNSPWRGNFIFVSWTKEEILINFSIKWWSFVFLFIAEEW